MQQLPKPKEDGEAAEIVVRYNNEIRAFFKSRPGYKFVDCDYESLETVSVNCLQNPRMVLSKGRLGAS